MTAPLAPVVVGPVYAVPDVMVRVDNVLPDSQVQVLRNDVEVAQATSGSTAGTVWVPVTERLAVNDKITAAQAYVGSDARIPATPGVLSLPSLFAVPVLAVPARLPTPVFQSLVNHCSYSVFLDHLIPGALVTITQDIPGTGSTVMGGDTVKYPAQEFKLTGPEPASGQRLQAIQGFGDNVSAVGLSARVAPKPASLPKPAAAPPLLACQTTMDLSNLVPGAEIAVINGGVPQGGTIKAASCTAGLAEPLKEGPLTLYQYFERCTDVPPSPQATYNVTSQDPPAPIVGYSMCAGVGQLQVDGLLPNELLTVNAVDAAGQVRLLGSQGVGATSVPVNLPRLPLGTQELRVSVSLCGRSAGDVTVQVTNDLGAYKPLTMAPLYECAMQVTVLGARPGALLTVHLNQHTDPLADPVPADSDVKTITLWQPLVAGQSVQVTQSGCGADGTSRPQPVLPLPSPVPVPVIATPLLSDATAVEVSNLLPGAQLTLSVNGLAALQTYADLGTSRIHLAAGALDSARFVAVSQQLCENVSLETDGPPALVPVQKAAPKPAGGLVGNSGYMFQNSCKNLTGVKVEIDVTREIGGGGPSYAGFSFQLNCWSAGLTDVLAWQQFAIVVDPAGVSSPSIQAVANAWPYNWDGTVTDDTKDVYPSLASLATANLPAGYRFSIELTSDSNGKITAAIFGGHDDSGNALTPVTITLAGQRNLQGGTIADSDLAPIVAFQVLLVGADGGQGTTLTSGAGTWTISASDSFIATNALPTGPTGNCWSFPATSGTGENSNCTYGELPAASSRTFTQAFSV